MSTVGNIKHICARSHHRIIRLDTDLIIYTIIGAEIEVIGSIITLFNTVGRAMVDSCETEPIHRREGAEGSKNPCWLIVSKRSRASR